MRAMLKGAGLFVLTLVLLVGTTASAFAQQEDEPQYQGISGVVTSVDSEAGTVTVETEEGQTITVAITPDTRIRLPSEQVRSAAEVELEEGASVSILAEVTSEGDLVAIWTLIKPERPRFGHLLGTIISVEDNGVTVVDAQGNEHTVEMPEQAMRSLQVGDIATLVVDQSDGNGEDGDQPDNPVAQAAVTATQIQERVRAHAGMLQERAQSGDVPVTTAEGRIQFLSELMDIINAHVQDILTAVLDKVPPQAQAAIEQAMERAGAGFGSAKEAIQRMGPPEGVGPSDNTTPPDGIPGPGGAGRSQR